MKKLKKITYIFKKQGINEVINQLFHYVKNHTVEKWKYIYLQFDLEDLPLSLPLLNPEITIKRATLTDVSRIENDLYPTFDFEQEYDKRYFSLIGKEEIECFIAEKHSKIVNYFFVFPEAHKSPLLNTPFNKNNIQTGDAYIGSTFTVPNERGTWITPYVLEEILKFLSTTKKRKRALLIIHARTSGAIVFFQRMGFKLINNPIKNNLYYKLGTFLGIISFPKTVKFLKN